MKEGPSHVDISRNTFQEEIAATEKAFSWPGWDGQGGPFFFSWNLMSEEEFCRK